MMEWSGYTENMKTIIVTSSTLLDVRDPLTTSNKQQITLKV